MHLFVSTHEVRAERIGLSFLVKYTPNSLTCSYLFFADCGGVDSETQGLQPIFRQGKRKRTRFFMAVHNSGQPVQFWPVDCEPRWISAYASGAKNHSTKPNSSLTERKFTAVNNAFVKALYTAKKGTSHVLSQKNLDVLRCRCICCRCYWAGKQKQSS